MSVIGFEGATKATDKARAEALVERIKNLVRERVYHELLNPEVDVRVTIDERMLGVGLKIEYMGAAERAGHQNEEIAYMLGKISGVITVQGGKSSVPFFHLGAGKSGLLTSLDSLENAVNALASPAQQIAANATPSNRTH